MGPFSKILDNAISPWRLILGQGNDKDEARFQRELEKVLAVTSPFRVGANVLAQNYGPAVRALTGQDPNTLGAFESMVREGVTPDEQRFIEEKPYLAALKSSAGMASTLMPYASRIAPASNLLARTGQIAGRGALEGAMGGFGYSREGKELQDTLTGGAIGAGGELLGNYIFDPSYRDMVNTQFDEGIPDTNQSLLQEARKYKSADEFYNRMSKEVSDSLRDLGVRGREQVEAFWNKNVSSAGQVLDSLNPTGGLYVDYDPKSRMNMPLGENITTLDRTMGRRPDETITIYRGAPEGQKKINPGDFITTNYDLAKSYSGDNNVLQMMVRLRDILDDITEPLGEEYIYRPNSK